MQKDKDRVHAFMRIRENMSEVTCRVSSDLHEKRNDCHTVSTGNSAKLYWPCRCGLHAARRKDPVHLYYSLTVNSGVVCVGYVGGFVTRALASVEEILK